MAQNRPYISYLMLFALSDYIPVMTNTEITLLLNGYLEVEQALIDKWESLLHQRQCQIENLFSTAYAKQ